MRLYGKKSLATALQIVLAMLLLCGAGVFFYIFYRVVSSNYFWAYYPQGYLLLAFYTVGGFALGHILYRFLRITRTLIDSNPFTPDNVKSLKWIAYDCFAVSACYLINFIVNPAYGHVEIITIDIKGIHTDVEYLIFLFAGCFILILSKVFEQAVVFKEENDLTV